MSRRLIDGNLIDKPLLKLTEDELVDQISKRKNLIPIDLIDNQLIWIDFDDFHLSEWELPISVRALSKSNRNFYSVSSDFSILQNDDIFKDHEEPTGLIFHMSRCGSTVISKSLSVLQANHVITHSPASFKYWQYITHNWTKALAVEDSCYASYKNLIYAMGPQKTSNKTYFIKFCSFESNFISHIKNLFPDVPCLFIFRDPSEVIVSLLNYSPRWIRDRDKEFGMYFTKCSPFKIESQNFLTYYEKVLFNLLSTVLETIFPSIYYLNYTRLKPENFKAILNKAFNYYPKQKEIDAMKIQFKYYSKDEIKLNEFIPDSISKQKAITSQIEMVVKHGLQKLFQELEISRQNI